MKTNSELVVNLLGFSNIHLETLLKKYEDLKNELKLVINQSGILKHSFEAAQKYDRYETYSWNVETYYSNLLENNGRKLPLNGMVICIGDKNSNQKLYNSSPIKLKFIFSLKGFPTDYFPIIQSSNKIFCSSLIQNKYNEELCDFEEIEIDLLELRKENLSVKDEEYELIKSILDKINNFIEHINNQVQNFNNNQNSKINELDKNKDGQIDLIDDNSFYKLLNKNQKMIIEVDKNYIQKFVKISLYLKTKKLNIQKIFDSIKETKNEKELNELIHLLRNQIHTYDLLVFHSISMITSLVNSELITFYEIHECFDKLGVFNSNWENDVSNKLSNIGDGIKELMYSIAEMESRIVESIDNLTYVTEDSFKDLNDSIELELSSINSSIGFNNLLTTIQTYQMYKFNRIN